MQYGFGVHSVWYVSTGASRKYEAQTLNPNFGEPFIMFLRTTLYHFEPHKLEPDAGRRPYVTKVGGRFHICRQLPI